MKLLLLSAAVILAPFLWLAASLALARWRGRQISRWLREREGQEFMDPDCRPRNGKRVILAVKWEADR